MVDEMKLTVTPRFPGSSKYDGTVNNPCEPGSVQLFCKVEGFSGAVTFRYSIEWVDAKFCQVEVGEGPTKKVVVLNKFQNFGWEGRKPFFGLPPTHNRKQNPASVRIGVVAYDSTKKKHRWEQVVYFFTRLCPCRLIDVDGQDYRDWWMWKARARGINRSWISISTVADNSRLQVDRVMYTIMKEKWPEVFGSAMFGATFQGTKAQLVAGVEWAEEKLAKETEKPEPTRQEITNLLEEKMAPIEKPLDLEFKYQRQSAGLSSDELSTALLRDQVREIAEALANVQKALASLSGVDG